jgi:hypothetical protein
MVVLGRVRNGVVVLDGEPLRTLAEDFNAAIGMDGYKSKTGNFVQRFFDALRDGNERRKPRVRDIQLNDSEGKRGEVLLMTEVFVDCDDGIEFG